MINQALRRNENLFIDFSASLFTLSIIKIIVIRSLLLFIFRPRRRDIIEIVGASILLLLNWVSIIVLFEVAIFISIVVPFISKYVIVSEPIIVVFLILLRCVSIMHVISMMIVQELLLIPIGIKLILTLDRVRINVVRMITTFNHWICISCIPFKCRANFPFINKD